MNAHAATYDPAIGTAAPRGSGAPGRMERPRRAAAPPPPRESRSGPGWLARIAPAWLRARLGRFGSQPGDVRLMNLVSAIVFALVVIALVAAGALAVSRAKLFEIDRIRLDGDLTRNSIPTIRANALPLVTGNFWSVDLQRAQGAFESVPWVRRAVVRRVWPDTLAVHLEEHRAAALWEGEGANGAEQLVNSFGEVFDANVGDVEDDGLPVFSGPPEAAPMLLALHRRLQPMFAQRRLAIERLVISGRGSVRAEVDNGATIEMGRGTEAEIVARADRFLRTLPQLAARWSQPLEYADLRHAEGYAVRLRGVTTVPAPAPGKPGTN